MNMPKRASCQFFSASGLAGVMSWAGSVPTRAMSEANRTDGTFGTFISVRFETDDDYAAAVRCFSIELKNGWIYPAE